MSAFKIYIRPNTKKFSEEQMAAKKKHNLGLEAAKLTALHTESETN
jgi:hypothetical protein